VAKLLGERLDMLVRVLRRVDRGRGDRRDVERHSRERPAPAAEPGVGGPGEQRDAGGDLVREDARHVAGGGRQVDQDAALALDPQAAQGDQEASEEQQDGEVVETACRPQPDRGGPREEQRQQGDRDGVLGRKAKAADDEVEADRAAEGEQRHDEVMTGGIRAEHLV
jgi:hypothetical protein